MKLTSRIGYYFAFTTALLFICTNSFSQKKEFKGYYLNQNGDTIIGVFPEYKQWGTNPDKVSFITTSSNTRIQLTPLNTLEFSVDKYDTYIAYRGKRMSNPIDFNTATSSNTDVYDTITTFLREIAASKDYRFLVYKDDNRINLFYAGKDKKTVELQQKGALINNSLRESMTFKQQLKDLFPSEPDKIDELTYTEESVASFINKQNKEKIGFNKVKNTSNGFIVMVGGSLNSLKFTGDKSFDYGNKDYPSNVVPVAAIGYITSISRNFNKFFLLPELKIVSFKHTAKTQYSNGNSYPALVNTFQSSAVVSFGFHFGYNIVNNSNLKFFVAPGAGISLLIKNKQTDEYQYSATSGKTIVTAMPGTTYLLEVKTGVVFSNKYLAWLAYNLPTTITSYSASKGNLTSIQLGIGYKLQ